MTWDSTELGVLVAAAVLTLSGCASTTSSTASIHGERGITPAATKTLSASQWAGFYEGSGDLYVDDRWSRGMPAQLSIAELEPKDPKDQGRIQIGGMAATEARVYHGLPDLEVAVTDTAQLAGEQLHLGRTARYEFTRDQHHIVGRVDLYDGQVTGHPMMAFTFDVRRISLGPGL